MNANSRKANVHRSPSPPSQGSSSVHIPRRSSKGPTILAECDTDELSHFVCEVVAMGHLVSFSATSDGGACCITIKADGRRYKAYPKNEETTLNAFRDLLEAVRGEE